MLTWAMRPTASNPLENYPILQCHHLPSIVCPETGILTVRAIMRVGLTSVFRIPFLAFPFRLFSAPFVHCWRRILFPALFTFPCCNLLLFIRSFFSCTVLFCYSTLLFHHGMATTDRELRSIYFHGCL